MIISEEMIKAVADECGIDLVGYDRCIKFAREIIAVTKEVCANEAEKTVTMEGYEKEIARDIRAI
jgi:hypothetical protein